MRKEERIKDSVHQRVKKTLSDRYTCYVLITCDPPTADGDMEVEMSFGGNTDLAAMLIEGAQLQFEEEVAESLPTE